MELVLHILLDALYFLIFFSIKIAPVDFFGLKIWGGGKILKHLDGIGLRVILWMQDNWNPTFG